MSEHSIHTEGAFETAIVTHLAENGWHEGKASDFSRDLAFDKKAVLDFIQKSQAKEWKTLQSYYNDETESKFIQRLFKELDLRGMLDVIRHGITDSGVKFKLAYFKPDSSRNPDTVELYKQNVLHITRQVYFSTKSNKSIDLLLSLNGLPVATIELKNHFTGQTVTEAMEQYKTNRDPKELLFQFKKRALVHFTVDPDEVYLTTKLDTIHTRFLPFNKGYNNGAGNPPAKDYATYRSAYFWKEMLQTESWLELIGRFLHLQKEEYLIDGKKYTKETMLFPRYHQIDVVRQITSHSKINGAGNDYLIQHSAGSGKSNSIAWLAYRLSSLYNSKDSKIFDSVIVITDRNVLDQQLQNTIYQFEHKTGVVQRIDENSEQLAEAIKAGTSIIITTLQKFPFAVKHVSSLPKMNFAVIIDEAHSSQGGEATKKLKEVLSKAKASEEEMLKEAEAEQIEIEKQEQDSDDFIRETILQRGPQSNISFFAFTATPKPKTLEVFGVKDVPNEEAKIIQWAFEELQKDNSNSDDIRKAINEKGIKCSKNNFLYLIRNPVYCGKIQIPAYKEEEAIEVRGQHDPIVSEQLFYDVQDILNGRRRRFAFKISAKKELPLRGYFLCPRCNKKLSGSASKGGSGIKHFYYHCRKGCPERVKANHLNDAFGDYLKSIIFDSEPDILYQQIVKEFYKSGNEEKGNSQKHIEEEIRKNKDRINNAQQMMLDGAILPKDYKDIKDRYEPIIDKLVRQHLSMIEIEAEFKHHLKKGLNRLKELEGLYVEAELEDKQNIVRSLCKEFFVFHENKVRTTKESQLLSLISRFDGQYSGKKNKADRNFNDQPYMVGDIGLLSNEILEELKKISNMKI